MIQIANHDHTENSMPPNAQAPTKMVISDTAFAQPLHRLSPAARAFFGHQPAGEWAHGWPSPLRVAVRLLQNRINPPLCLDQLHQLAAMLHSESECAVVRHWFESATYLRQSELSIVAAYALDRDADHSATASGATTLAARR